MPSTKPVFTLRTEKINLDKLKVIASVENRSDNKQLEKILTDYIKDWEKENGIIKVETE